MREKVELLTGIGKHDQTYGFIAIQPPLSEEIIQGIMRDFPRIISSSEIDDTTELTLRLVVPDSHAISRCSKKIATWLHARGLEVELLNAGYNDGYLEHIEVDGAGSLFAMYEEASSAVSA